MDIKRTFGQAVKAARGRLGISQEELGMRIDADQAYVSRVEAGQQNVTLDSAAEIAAALGVGLDELVRV